MTCSPSGQTRFDHDIRSALVAGLHSLHHRLTVLDDEDIDAFLIGDQRRLWDHDLLLGGAALDIDAHQLAVDQKTIRVWALWRATSNGIGRAIDRDVDEIDDCPPGRISIHRRNECVP